MKPASCPGCGAAVPAQEAWTFCGHCGAALGPDGNGRPAWLRPKAFCAAPEESVWRPSLSMLLPQVPRIARRPFVVGLVTIVLTMAVLVDFYRPRAIITVASLGFPVLLVICWRRAGLLQARPRWAIVTTVGLAMALAVVWVLSTGDLITTMAESPLDAGTSGRRVLRDGLGIAEGGALLMLVPAAVVRLMWRSRRTPVDGFVVGVLSAVVFTAAATVTRLAPQLALPPISRGRHVPGLFLEAAVRGLTVPLTVACAGGLFGLLLWFDRSAGTAQPRVRPAPVALLAVLGAAVLGLYAFMGRSDGEHAPQLAVLVEHSGMVMFALLTLRLGMQLALLHGNRAAPGALIECQYCRKTMPQLTFCPHCGGGQCPPHASVPQKSVAARAGWTPALRVSALWLAVTAAIYGTFIGVPALVVKPPPRYECPPDCGSPPTGRPVSTNPRFTAADGSFSVAYPAPGTAYELHIHDGGVTATFTQGDGGKMRLTSEPARGRTAQEIAHAFVTKKFPTAIKAFELPNAMVGFQPGYGEVSDIFPLSLQTASPRLRSVIVVAIKNDLALIAAAVGPYREFGPDFGPGRPSPTNLQIAEDMGRYVNSFRWRGDPLA